MIVYANTGNFIHIGRAGEHLATQVIFDISEYKKAWGVGTAQLLVEKDFNYYPQVCYQTGTKKYELNIAEELPAGHYYFEDLESNGTVILFELSQSITSGILKYEPSNETKFFVLTKTVDGVNSQFPCTRKFIGEVTKADINITESGTILEEGEISEGIVNTYTYLDFASSDMNTNNSYVIWEITKADTQKPGVGKCSLTYYDINNTIKAKSPIYSIIVTNALGDDQEEEPAEYNWVELVLDKATYIETKIDDAIQSAKDAAAAEEKAKEFRDLSEAWAVGEKQGEPVVEGEEQYNNNSKYWAEESSKTATLSESWAVGGTGTRDGEDDNNSKYWSEESQAWATGKIGDEVLTEGAQFENNAEYYSGVSKKWAIGANDEDVENAQHFYEQSKKYAVGADETDTENAQHYYEQSKKYAIGENDEDTENAQYYYKQSKEYAIGETESAKHYYEQTVDQVVKAESWAVGDTGTREGENTNNSKYWAGQSEQFANTAGGHAEQTTKDIKTVEGLVSQANTAKGAAETAKDDAEKAKKDAETARDVAKDYIGNPPEPRENGTWWVYDPEAPNAIEGYRDTYKRYGFHIDYVITGSEQLDSIAAPKGTTVAIQASITEPERAQIYLCTNATLDENGVPTKSEWTYVVDLAASGSGEGDMKVDDYDIDRKVADARYNGSYFNPETSEMEPADFKGIPAYVKNNATQILWRTWSDSDFPT